MKTKIEEMIATAATSPEAAKECSEKVLAVIRDVAGRLREKYHGETSPIEPEIMGSYVLGKCNAMCDMLDLVDGKCNIDLEQLPIKDMAVFRGWLSRDKFDNTLILNVSEKEWDGDPYILLPRQLFTDCTKERTMNVKVTIEEEIKG